MTHATHLLAVQYPTLADRLHALDAAVRHATLTTVSGVWTRAVVLTHIVGAARNGGNPRDVVFYLDGYQTNDGRYVRRGLAPAYHVADSRLTALAEIYQMPGAPPVPAFSEALLRIVVAAPSVLDLMDTTTLAQLGVTPADLTQPRGATIYDDAAPGYAITQAIGEIALGAGHTGIRYPSAQSSGGVGLVIFAENMAQHGATLSAPHPSDPSQTVTLP